MARSNSGMVKKPHNYMRNPFPSYSGQEYEEVMWMKPEVRTVQLLMLSLLSWVTPPSLCVRHHLWACKREGMLGQGEKDHFYGAAT